MILTFPKVLAPEEHQTLLDLIATADFVPGRETAGRHLAAVKDNLQIAKDNPVLSRITEIVLGALRRHDAFRRAVYPKQLHSLLVSRYTPDMHYGPHVDAALMGEAAVWRSDLSLTLFLSPPDAYDGGELAVESGSGEIRIKLAAPDLVCYPTSQLHQVLPVTRGERLAVVGWIQSHVRDASAREALWDLAQARELIRTAQDPERAYALVNKAHTNLLRRWAEP